MRRAYVDAGWGQLHYRAVGAGRVLACLHATAYSGRSMAPLLPYLAHRRRVLALDTPGYGGSDGPAEPVRFEAYAGAIADALGKLSPGAPVELFGYHTGALLAVEIAAQRPALVRGMVLVGIPFFVDEEREVWRRKLVHRTTLDESLDQFRHRWDYFVTNRAPGVALSRGFDNFTDELVAYPREWWAHAALFDYESADRLPMVRCPVLVLNPTIPLADASRAAAARIPGALLRDMPEVPEAPFDTAPDVLAEAMMSFLDA